MLGRTVFAATVLALAEFAVATSTPSCLLGAASQYSSADLKTVCQSKDLKTEVSMLCGDETDAAMSFISDMCNSQTASVASVVASATGAMSTGSSPKTTGSASHNVPLYPTASGTGSGSYNSANGTMTLSATGTPKPVTTSASPSSSSTHSANSAAGMADFGLAAAVAGLMVAAL